MKKMMTSILPLCLLFVFLCMIAAQYMPVPTDTAVSKEVKPKIMYLTFDDGPSRNTEKILDILDEYKVKATFFVTGENPDYYNMIAEEKKRGHAIGVHTFSHDYKNIYSSEEAYYKDVDKVNSLIKKQINESVRILRFPGGVSNTVSRKFHIGIMSKLSKSVLEKGYQYYDWNASNGDGNCFNSVDTLVSTGLKEVRDKDEVMMLMHDGSSNKATVQALPILLKSYQSQGYEFRIIDNNTSVFHHHIAN